MNNTLISRGISGSTLKIIAMISMLIDHIAVVFLKEYTEIYSFLRKWIGRMAFPIFCFLLVEGFMHTGNRMKYAIRLFLFALISELPFNFILYGSLFDNKHQNIFFTLLIGLLMMWGMEKAEQKIENVWFQWMLKGMIIAAAAFLAEKTFCNYRAMGILAIALLYLFRFEKWAQIVVGVAAFCWEPTAMLAFLPIAFYNGKRGLRLKYVFYLFYPVHLIILYLLYLLF